MTKILYISDSPALTTGYGKVGKELLKGLHENGYEVRAMGCGDSQGNNDLPYPIYPTNPQKDYWGYSLLPHILNTYEPDIIMTLADPWAVEPLPKIIDHFPVYWIGYFPVDGKPLPKKWAELINKMNKIVVISKFARNAVHQLLPDREIEVLYHGVDSNKYRPYREEDIKKGRELNGWQDKFVVLNVNRNQIRKQIPLTIKAFAKFARDKDDVLLVLRMHASERVGWDLPELLERFNLQGKATIIDAPPGKGIPEEQLIDLYNLADIHVSTTSGEGFGLTTLEAMSCGVPVIITDCSNSRELIQSEKQLIKVKEMIISHGNIEQAYADSDDLADKLEYFYYHRDELKMLGNQEREFAVNTTWDHARKELMRIIKNVEKELANTQSSDIKFYKI
ncbi:MAG: glycosyltransferase family 4 protein [Clostridiales bacterium]|nr:glycosyltransferase family 4 protein [Clostridiales bacterium]MCF8022840.1 glycosyltransferase family 4 protein [Clostridiales bacterium]